MSEANTDQSKTSQNSEGAGGGDAAAAAAAAAAAGAGAAKGGGGGGEEQKSWLELLPETMRGHKSLAKYESPEALATAHINLEKRFGIDPTRRLDLPEDMNDQAAMAEVYDKLGRPKTPEEYGLNVPDTASEDIKATVAEIAKVAHAQGLNKTQLEPFLNLLYQKGVDADKAQAEADKLAGEATEAKLKEAWGEKFDVYMPEVGKLIHDTVGKEGLEALTADGLGNSVTLNVMLGKILDRMAESGTLAGAGAGGGGGGGAATPYQAQAQLSQLYADEKKMAALRDDKNPAHKTVLKEREELLKIAYPSQT